jgi:nitrogen PTS system EIIA component
MDMQVVTGTLADDAVISLDAIVPHRKATIALSADLLASKAGMTYHGALSALATREALGSTAIGRGVALPHALSPGCHRPAIALIRLVSPVSFNSPDNIDVDIVLAVLWPSKEIKSFQKVAEEFCRIRRDQSALNAIRRAASASEIRPILKRFCRLPIEP